MQSQEAREQSAQEFLTVYSDSDRDNDGLLNLEEWKAFTRRYSELKASRNEPETTQTDEIREKWYNVMNKATPGIEGVSMNDIGEVLSISMQHLQNIMTSGH